MPPPSVPSPSAPTSPAPTAVPPPPVRAAPVRLAAAVVLGLATAAAGAVVLGDYPLSGSVPWVAAVLIPALIGVVMSAVAGGHRRPLWVATGPLGLGALAWGVRIATGWGLDPVPVAVWASLGVGLVWPVVWGLAVSGRSARRPGRSGPAPGR